MSKCILWTGAKDKDGYGRVKINGKLRRAHRISLEIKIGRLLNRKEIAMHLCDNPSCINKDHLEVGTTKENNRQARKRRKCISDNLLKGWRKLYGYGDDKDNGMEQVE